MGCLSWLSARCWGNVSAGDSFIVMKRFHRIDYSYFSYHFRAGEVAWLLCMLNLINVSVSMIQVLGNGSSISSKSTRLQNNIFGTSIPCDSLVLQLSYPAILITALLFLSFAGFCCFNCLVFFFNALLFAQKLQFSEHAAYQGYSNGNPSPCTKSV